MESKSSTSTKSIEDKYLSLIEIIEVDPNRPLHETLCCLIDDNVKCERVAGNASYNKRVQKVASDSGLNLRLNPESHHVYICDAHKEFIQSVRMKHRSATGQGSAKVTTYVDLTTGGETDKPSTSKANEVKNVMTDDGSRKNSGSSSTANLANLVAGGIPEVDFSQLRMSTLRRYKRTFQLQLPPNLNKPQLVEAIQQHFKTIDVDAKEVLPFFIYSVKTKSNKLDYPETAAAAGSNSVPTTK